MAGANNKNTFFIMRILFNIVQIKITLVWMIYTFINKLEADTFSPHLIIILVALSLIWFNFNGRESAVNRAP
jgi:hypothetical protein